MLTSAVLSIFSGHLIESTFNIMDYIVEKVGIKLAIENEAIAIVKTTLKSQNVSKGEMIVDAKLKTSGIRAFAYNQDIFEWEETISSA